MKHLLSVTIALLLLTTNAFASDLGGGWYHGDQRTFISNTGPGGVVIRTEDGRMIAFHFVNQNTLVADNERLAGTVTDGGRTIQWTNGTIWTRLPVVSLDVSGTWFHKVSATSIRRAGTGYVLRNEDGLETRLELRGNRLVQPDGPLNGVIQSNGQIIEWNNNTIWRRTPALG